MQAVFLCPCIPRTEAAATASLHTWGCAYMPAAAHTDRSKDKKKNPLCMHTAGFSWPTPAEAGATLNYLADSIADLAASAALSASALAASTACSAAGATASAAGAAASGAATGASTAGAAASGAGASTAGAAGATGASSFLPQATRAAEAITVAKMKAFFISIPLRVEKGCSAVPMHGRSAASAVPEMDIVCTLAFPHQRPRYMFGLQGE